MYIALFFWLVASRAYGRSQSHWCIFEKVHPWRTAPYLHWGRGI